MSNHNVSQSPTSPFDSGFNTFTNANIYRSTAGVVPPRTNYFQKPSHPQNNNNFDEYTANLVMQSNTGTQINHQTPSENLISRQARGLTDSKFRPVHGRHVLGSKAVKNRNQSHRPQKAINQSQAPHYLLKQSSPATIFSRKMEPRIADSIDGTSYFNSYKGSQLRVVQSHSMMTHIKPKVTSDQLQQPLHTSQNPNFSEQNTNLNTENLAASFKSRKFISDPLSKLQNNSRRRFQQALQQSQDSKLMPKVNPMAMLYQHIESEVKTDKKITRAINKQFDKLWSKNTYRSQTGQLIIDNEKDLKRQAVSQKDAQAADSKILSQRSSMLNQLNQQLGVVTGSEYLILQKPTNQSVEAQTSPKRKMPKSLSRFVQRDELFKKQFTEQLKSWEEQEGTQNQQPTAKPEYSEKKYDTNLYKEREDDYPIVANRIMHRAQDFERRYINKTNAKMLQDSFDPIRIRLRIIPISKAPVGKGKNADFYFVEAGKKSMRGELPQAIELLKRGLTLTPNHFLCRFNHGVLQFKFGLVVEASQDFKELTLINPKEPLSFYNLAICLVQMGVPNKDPLAVRPNSNSAPQRSPTNQQSPLKQQEITQMTAVKRFEYIIQLCQKVVALSKHHHDKNLTIDAFFLQAVSYYRLHKPLDAVAAFNAGKRIKRRMEESQQHAHQIQTFEQIYADVLLEEVEHEVQKVERKVRNRRSSFDFKRHKKLDFSCKRRLSQAHIEKYSDDEVSEKNASCSSEDASVIETDIIVTSNRIIDSGEKEEQMEENIKLMQGENRKRRITFEKKHIKNDDQVQLLDRASNWVQRQDKQLQKSMKRVSQDFAQKSDQKECQSASPIKKNQTTQGDDIHVRSQLKQMKKELFPKPLPSAQHNAIDKESRLFQQVYASLLRQQDKIVDGDEQIRFRNMYLVQHDVVKGIFENCNEKEVEELLRRKELEDWIVDTDFLKQQLIEYLKKMDSQQDSRLVDMILKIAPIKQRIVAGTDIDALRYVLVDQNVLVDKMENLETKYLQKSQVTDAELRQQEKKLFSLQITDEDIKFLSGQEKHQNMEEYKLGKKDILIERLQESLHQQNMTSDDVCNLLTNDLYEREKKASQMKNASEIQSGQRFACRHLQVLQIELEKSQSERNLKLMDKLLSHLRYFKRLDHLARMEFFQLGTFVKYDAQQIIFQQNDIGDYMYIILKGKIAVKVNMLNKKDIQSVVAMCNDGDCFGELSLFDFNKIQVSDKGLKNGETADQKPNTRRRGGTCIAVEETFLLRISHQEAREILQPDAQRLIQREERSQTVLLTPTLIQTKMMATSESGGSIKAQTKPLSPRVDDEIGRKIKFLQSFDFFKDFGKKSLMPIAVNMQQVNFSYGDYIQREGIAPKGLYLIKSGQCIVGKSVIAKRDHNPSELPGGRKLLRDNKNQVFNEYDVENTLLNNVRQQNKAYQNSRIFVSEKGEQIRGEIHYENILTYQQLVPGNWFGGRVLLPFELYISQRRIYFGQNYVNRPRSSTQGDESEEKYQLKSLLNIIADSGVVETYLITKTEIQYLRDSDLKGIYNQIVQVKEPDRPNTEHFIQSKFLYMQGKEKEKIEITRQVIERNHIEKYGPNTLQPRN